MGSEPKIAVLMTTYNGEAFLAEQLDSILAQTHGNWTLTVSDDGSMDGTEAMVRHYQECWPGRLSWTCGPQQGFVANFMSLTANVPSDADYCAWSDQDDVWLPGKLARAVGALKSFGQDDPALYCGRTILVDRDNREYGLSPLMNRVPPSFANALVQCIAGGNTMVFNQPAKELIALGQGHDLASHDWWAYMIVTGAGGHVIYDPTPTLRYRQTGGNAMGSNKGIRAKAARLKAVAKGAFRKWAEGNIEALSANVGRLTGENRHILQAFAALHGEGGMALRLGKLRKGGFPRQSVAQSAFLYAMAALRWV